MRTHPLGQSHGHRIADLPRAMRTDYIFDEFQKTYFVVDSFEDLLRITDESDFSQVYKEISALPILAPDEKLASDVEFTLHQPAAKI